MTDPESYKLGPGTLIVGDTGTPLEISCQITAATVEFSVDTDDDVPTLCGGTLAGDETETASLTGTIIQDLSDDGVIEYTWAHSGEVLPVVFVPNTDEGKQITGNVKMRRLNVGGDVKTSPTSDFEWPFVGLPELGPVADAGPATGATAGTPGTWTPAGSTPPADAAAAVGVVASPTTAWSAGQYMQGSAAGAAGEMYWSGSAWTAGKAP